MAKKGRTTASKPVPSSVPAHIRYHNPYGGHPILRRDGRAAYDAVLEFLRECTDWTGRWGSRRIEVIGGPKFMPAGWDHRPLARQLIAELGEGHQGVQFSSSIERDGEFETVLERNFSRAWDVPKSQQDWAVNVSLAQIKSNRGWMSPVKYDCSADFRLRRPGDSRPLPGQSSGDTAYPAIRSEISMSVSSSNTSAFFSFAFPFAQADEAFVDYVRAIRPYLPIRLAKKGFRVHEPKKSGEGFKVRVIPASLFANI